MGLIFTEGFDSFAASADLLKKWSAADAAWVWSSAIGRNGGGGVQANATGGVAINLTSQSIFGGATSGIFHIGFYVKLTAGAPSGNTGTLCGITDLTVNSGGCGFLRIVSFPVGVIALFNSTFSVIVNGTTNVCDGNWHWIEWMFNLANSSNPSRLYVDGNLQWTTSVVMNDQGRSADKITFQIGNSGISVLAMDDIIAYDNNAPAPINASFPLGPREIRTLRPNADSAVQFTPDTGVVNFSRVNEVNGDGDTSYVQDATSGHQDLYDFTDLSPAPSSITAVMLNAYLENPSAGSINFQQICKSNVTQTNGASILTPTSYKIQQQAFNQDPDTAAAWTIGGLNAAKFGIKVP